QFDSGGVAPQINLGVRRAGQPSRAGNRSLHRGVTRGAQADGLRGAGFFAGQYQVDRAIAAYQRGLDAVVVGSVIDRSGKLVERGEAAHVDIERSAVLLDGECAAAREIRIRQALQRQLVLAGQLLDEEIVATGRRLRAHRRAGVTFLTEGRAVGEHARGAAVELGNG